MPTALLFLIGLVALVAGGELLVRGSVGSARRLGVSPLLIGLTLVGFGTSMPELVTSVEAALVGSPGIAVGNVVGSNIANILLILGLAAVVRPIAVTVAAVRRDAGVMIAAAVVCALALATGTITRWIGLLFVVALAAYVVFSYLQERGDALPSAELHRHEAEAVQWPGHALWLALLVTLAGLALTILGARWLVAAAIELAQSAGLSQTLIGLTIVAVGTSLPELTTSVLAARRGQSDVAVGNILGSNIYNVLGILGVTGLIAPVPTPAGIMSLDIWVMLGVSALAIVFAATGGRISRREGTVLLGGYLAYLLAAQAGYP